MADIEIFGTLVRNDGGMNRDKIVRGMQVEGGFFVCATVPTSGNWQSGQLCFCTTDSKFYQYNGATWAAALEAKPVVAIPTAEIEALWEDAPEEPEDTPAEPENTPAE